MNDDIDRMRHRATRSLLERRDVIVVSSVSCIYGLGMPSAFAAKALHLEVRFAFFTYVTICYLWGAACVFVGTTGSCFDKQVIPRNPKMHMHGACLGRFTSGVGGAAAPCGQKRPCRQRPFGR